MIRSDLVICGKRCLEENVDSLNSNTYEFISEALRTLEQEPKDAVSRDAIRLKIADIPKYHNGTKITSTRQLKEFLEKAYEETIDVTPDICLGFTLALDYIREYIEDLPPVTPAQRWIPVSVKPPKDKQCCFVTKAIPGCKPIVTTATYSTNLYEVNRYEFADKKNIHGFYKYSSDGYFECTDVIAWMPSPEAYDGEEN